MRAHIQRVSQAQVVVENQLVGQIGLGYLILLGVGHEDSIEDIEYLTSKISSLRIFNDELGKMNLDILQKQGNCLVISQFTLYADTKKGNRPSYIQAAPPELANSLYETFCSVLSNKLGVEVQKGRFGAHMEVSLTNDGPVTILLDSKNK